MDYSKFNRIRENIETEAKHFNESQLEEIISLLQYELKKRTNFYNGMVNSIEDMFERGKENYYYRNMPYETYSNKIRSGVIMGGTSNEVSPNSAFEILKVFKKHELVTYKDQMYILDYTIEEASYPERGIKGICFKVKKTSDTPLKL